MTHLHHEPSRRQEQALASLGQPSKPVQEVYDLVTEADPEEVPGPGPEFTEAHEMRHTPKSDKARDQKRVRPGVIRHVAHHGDESRPPRHAISAR